MFADRGGVALDRVAIHEISTAVVQHCEGHISERPVEPQYQPLRTGTPRLFIDGLRDRPIQILRRVPHVLAPADRLQKCSDVPLQRRPIHGGLIFVLPQPRGDKHAQPLVREQIESERGVRAE